MGKFPFYSLISLLQRKYVGLYSFPLSGCYFEWSVKGTWISECTFFIYLCLNNNKIPFFLFLLKRWMCTREFQQHLISNEPLSNLHYKWLSLFLQNLQDTKSSYTLTGSATVNEPMPFLNSYSECTERLLQWVKTILIWIFINGVDEIVQTISFLCKYSLNICLFLQ